MDKIIKLRVSAEDKAAFEAAAKTLGLSLSGFVRMASIKGSRQVLETVPKKGQKR